MFRLLNSNLRIKKNLTNSIVINNFYKINKMSSSSSSSSSLTIDNLSSWKTDFKENDKIGQLAGSVFRNGDIDQLLINRDSELSYKSNVFSNKIENEGSPVTDQKSSGRCWLFASTNALRIPLSKKFNLKEFQLSPSFLFFYDKLEKSNFFLEQIIDTYKEDINSRLIQFFLTDPISDGGQFQMMINIVNKYGLVPNVIFPDTYNTTSSRNMNRLITRKLREFAEILRNKLNLNEDITKIKLEMQQEIFRILCIFLGTPPGPNDKFTWEFYDKDNKFNKIESTPLEFVKKYVEFDTSNYYSLLNDPRNKYEKTIQIDRLNNVFGSGIVSYLNLEIDELSKAAIDRIKNNKPVFFGTDTPKFMDKKRGIMDIDLWDYKLIGYETKQSKASRVLYHESLMTHAMLITAVHLDDDGKPIRWRVENSWGSKSGIDGYYIMTHDYFKEYVYQIVVEKSDIPELSHLLDDKSPIVLPPYDPMGALATFKN